MSLRKERPVNVTQEYVAQHPIKKMKLHPENPRQGDVGAISESIEFNGFYGAVIVQKSTGYVIAGNHRLQAAEALGAKELPALIIDIDDEQAKRIMLADNRLGDQAVYDDDQLVAILRDLAALPQSLLGTGYDGDDLDDLIRLTDSLGEHPVDAVAEWAGMPGYESNDIRSYFSCTVHFANEQDAEAFFDLHGVERTKSFWFPQYDGTDLGSVEDGVVSDA